MVVDQSDIILFILTAVIVLIFLFIPGAPAQAQVTPLDRDIAADLVARRLAVDG